MVELVDEAERRRRNRVRCSSDRPPQSSPPISTAPPSGRSSSPATCSSVDLPAPDGPTSATISPGRSDEIDAVQHRELDAALAGRRWRTLRAIRAPVGRANPRTRFAARSFVAQPLDRIEPGGAPGRVERREERQRQRHHHDGGDLARVDAAPGCG